MEGSSSFEFGPVEIDFQDYISEQGLDLVGMVSTMVRSMVEAGEFTYDQLTDMQNTFRYVCQIAITIVDQEKEKLQQN